MKIIKNIIWGVLLLTASMATSCNKWLDAQPDDRVTDDQVFSTKEGFCGALNGIYTNLNDVNLYGGDMMFNFIDIIAQQYKFGSYQQIQHEIAKYNYSDINVHQRIQSIWERYYSTILNCNKLLEYAELRPDVLKGDLRTMVMGETIAMRAFLHFDLLRLFGPIYSVNSKAESIPYNDKFSVSAGKLLSAEEVIAKVLADLAIAETMLKEVDPIMTKGAREVGEDFEESYRALRLNYYAIKAIQARVNLYIGDKEAALAAAKEVITVQSEKFPFIDYKNIVGNSKNPDRIFSTELIFSLQNNKRDLIFDQYFATEVHDDLIFSPRNELSNIFTSDKDWRYTYIWLTTAEKDFRLCNKYAKLEGNNYYNDIMPMIRVSEMYYIVAECTTDSSEALTALNTIYENRGLDTVSDIGDLKEAIKQEYRKEFCAEGQLFFYYKRINEPQIKNLTAGNNTTMNATTYVIPLPKSETDFR